MTPMPLSLPKTHPAHSPLRTTARRLGMLALPVLLAACTSVPLPPWSPSGPQPAANAPASAAASAPAAAVEVFPVAPPASIGMSSAAPAAEPAPYGAAVAARFPAPSVIYNTPGLQAGRTAFTTETELQAWLRDQAASASRIAGVKAAVLEIGRSQRGATLQALILTRATGTDPAALLASGKPTVLLVGQQHGDEPAGSEALLVIARELAQGLLQPLLEQVNVVIVPRANPDGAASNQRATANGLDMNRDHLLLNTPEAQALARLTRDYQPTVVANAQEYPAAGRFLQKFGAVQKFDALLQYATAANLPEFLTKAAEEWYRRPLLAALRSQGLGTEWYYTTSADLADKKISMGGTWPDTSRNVNGLKNAVSLLIASRGAGLGRWQIQRRVHTQVTAMTSVLASTAQRASELSQLRPYLDKEVSAQACKGQAVVQAAPTPAQHELIMLDPVSGADKPVTVDWDSTLALRSLTVRARPCGYWLSAESGTATDRLRLFGVQVLRVTEPGSLLGDSYQETSRAASESLGASGSNADGNPVIRVQVSLTRGVVDVPRGSYYVPLRQPLGNLVFAALEPDTESSYFANQILDSLQSTVRVMTEPNLRLEELP
ncbi:MAG: M14 family metallopeptidase [Polaromonas sp.]